MTIILVLLTNTGRMFFLIGNNNNNDNDDSSSSTVATAAAIIADQSSSTTQQPPQLQQQQQQRNHKMNNTKSTIISGSTFETIPSATRLLSDYQFQYEYYEYNNSNNTAKTSSTLSSSYTIHILGDDYANANSSSSSNNNDTIVTAYYKIPSKHPPIKYQRWMKNLLYKYNDTIVIFTSPPSPPSLSPSSSDNDNDNDNIVNKIIELRKRKRRKRRKSNRTITTSKTSKQNAENSYDENSDDYDYYYYMTTIIVCIPLQELPIATLYDKSFWMDQITRDPQSNIHSPYKKLLEKQQKQKQNQKHLEEELATQNDDHGSNSKSNSNSNSKSSDSTTKSSFNLFDSGELYWIWLSKIWFVHESIHIMNTIISPTFTNSTNSSSGSSSSSPIDNDDNDNDNANNRIFAWIDIGSFREKERVVDNNDLVEHEHEPPEPLLLLKYANEIVPKNEMLFWSHYSKSISVSSKSSTSKESKKKRISYIPQPYEQTPYFNDKTFKGGKYFFHSGSHFIGYTTAIQRFYRHFLKTMDIFIERNMTLADDQAIFQSTCLSYASTATATRSNNNNLCAYATRHLVVNSNNNNNNRDNNNDNKTNETSLSRSQKSKSTPKLHKWFGLRTILENGLQQQQSSASNNRLTTTTTTKKSSSSSSSQSRNRTSNSGNRIIDNNNNMNNGTNITDNKNTDFDNLLDSFNYYKYNYWRPPSFKYYYKS